jgi:hypothetical protein
VIIWTDGCKVDAIGVGGNQPGPWPRHNSHAIHGGIAGLKELDGPGGRSIDDDVRKGNPFTLPDQDWWPPPRLVTTTVSPGCSVASVAL